MVATNTRDIRRLISLVGLSLEVAIQGIDPTLEISLVMSGIKGCNDQPVK